MTLRLAVVNTLKEHPMAKEWIKTLFNKCKRDYVKFVKAQSVSGTYSDNNGIIVTATAQYLNVILQIVPISGDNITPTY